MKRATLSTMLALVLSLVMVGTVAADSRWMSFLSRGITYNTASIEANESFSEALGWEDTDSAAYYAQRIKNLANGYIRWLDAHKPTSCYRSLWILERATAKNSAAGMTYWKRWLTAYPFGSTADFNRGMTLMKRALAQTERATAMIDRTHC